MEAVLFYSKSCSICKTLYEFKLFNNIGKICIDSIEVRKKLPPYITKVPSILIKSQGNYQVLTNTDVINWFDMVEKSNIKINVLNNSSNPNTQSEQPINNTPFENTSEIQNTYLNEGFSSMFSSIEGNNTNNLNSLSFLDDTTTNLNINVSNSVDNDKKTVFETDYEKMILERSNIK